MNSRRAALPRSSQAHGSGAGPRLQIEKSISRATTVSCWRLRTRPRSRGSTPARDSNRNSFGISPAARTSESSSGAPSSMWRSAIGLRASSPSRSVADSTPQISLAVDHDHVLGAGGEHLDGRLDRELGRRHGRRRAPRGESRRRVKRNAVHRQRRRTLASLTIPSSPSSTRTSRAETPSSPEPRRGDAQRLVGIAELGPAHDARHRRRADLGQPVHGVTRDRQAPVASSRRRTPRPPRFRESGGRPRR